MKKQDFSGHRATLFGASFALMVPGPLLPHQSAWLSRPSDCLEEELAQALDLEFCSVVGFLGLFGLGFGV
jgi:hypothetical protein